MKSKKKMIMITAAVIVIVAVIGLGAVKASQNKQEAGMLVKTAALEKQDIEAHILTSGEVIAIVKRQIMPDLGGKVEKVYVKDGDLVEAGQTLIKLESSELDYQIRQAELKLAMDKDNLSQLRKGNYVQMEIALSNADIQYKDAKSNYDKKKELYESGALSKSELDMAKSSLDQAHNAYVLAQKNLENAKDGSQVTMQEKQVNLSELTLSKLKKDIEKYTIKSPIRGTVVELTATEGGLIGSTMPIMTIVDTDLLEIHTNINEYDVNRLSVGQTVKITGDAFEGKEYAGKVKYIGPTAISINTGQGKETVVQVKVEVVDKNTAMKPGFTANVDVMTESKKGVLVVPYEAIFTRKNGDKVIYTVVDGKAKEYIIKTGIEGDLVVEVIAENLNEQDKVIMNPTEKLKDGDPVKENKVMNNDKNSKSN